MTYLIIIPTLRKSQLTKCLDSIKKYTPQDHRVVLVSEGSTWAEAVNFGIIDNPDSDVILMDDDIEVTPGWLDNIERYKNKADIIGWTLQRPDGTIQFSGCFLYKNGNRILMDNYHDELKEPRYTVNTTTSCVYIKKDVFKEIGLFDNDTYKFGCHYEDSDFCMRAKKGGFIIMVAPEIVIHGETQTKKDFFHFKERVRYNGNIFYNKLNSDLTYQNLMRHEGFLNG